MKEKVAEIMSRDVVVADIGDSLRHVNTLFKTYGIRHLPVVSEKKLAGIISRTDILRLSFGDMFEGTAQADDTFFDMLKLEDVMVRNPVTVSEEASIREVAERFSRVDFHAMPVVSGETLVGMVSTTDLIRYLLVHNA